MPRATRGGRIFLAAGVVLAACRLLPAAFCGPTRAASPPRRVALRAEEQARETSVAEPGLEINENLRFGSSLTGMLKPILQAQAKFAAGDYDQEAIRREIEVESKSAPVVMYTLSQSPFSIEAKRLLEESKVDYKEIEIAPLFILAEGDNAAKRAELGAMTDRTSLPHIFINGQSVGGLYDGSPGLVPLIENGEFEKMVRPPSTNPLDGLFAMFR